MRPKALSGAPTWSPGAFRDPNLESQSALGPQLGGPEPSEDANLAFRKPSEACPCFQTMEKPSKNIILLLKLEVRAFSV